jgi:hypothetical protein
MKWIRSHMSFANLVSLMALFIALGGTTYAAVALPKNSVGAKQIKKNGVGASEIKKNAVRAAEIKSSAVGASEIKSNAVASGDIADNGVGGADLADSSVGSGEVTDDSLSAADIAGSSLDAEIGPDFFARVATDGTVQPNVAGFPPQAKGIVDANIVKGEAAAATGTYCFDLPARPSSAVVSLDNADAGTNVDKIASVAIDRGEDLGDCPATHNDARVRILDTDLTAGGAEQDLGPADARFFIWFEQ